MKFQVPAIIQSIRTLADKTLRLTIDCQELPPEDSGKVMGLLQQYGWFVFSPSEIKEIDLPQEIPEFKNEKTPSQRLRAVLYRLWEQDKKGMDFEVFYKTRIERIIQQIKDKLL